MDTLKKMRVISILWGMILFTLLILLTAFALIFKSKSKVYEEAASNFANKAQEYVEEKNLYPEEGTLVITKDELIENEYIEELSVKDNVCEGYVLVKYEKDNYSFVPYINCKKYITGGYDKNRK